VLSFENSEVTHRDFSRQLHREVALRLNSTDSTPGRRVMYEFWDTRLTFEKSWLARLKYVHHNPLYHGLVALHLSIVGVRLIGLKQMRDLHL